MTFGQDDNGSPSNLPLEIGTPTTVPLLEAALEIRFPGDARIEALRGDFQSRIREDFPFLFVPKVNPGDSPALLPYRFQNGQATRIVGLALNSFSYWSYEYPGWESFLQEALDMWSFIAESISPETLTRVGLRYTNQFDSELKEHLNLESPPFYMVPLRNEVETHRSLTQFTTEDCSFVVSVLRLADKDELLLDYDVFVEEATPSKLSETLDTLHHKLEEEFKKCISSNLQNALNIR